MYKLLKIIHERCAEYDCTEYIMVSVNLSEDHIYDVMADVKRIVTAQTDSAEDPKPEVYYGLDSVARAYPQIKDLDELKRIMQSATEQHAAWNKRHLENSRRFIEILASYPGFVRLSDLEEPFSAEACVSWGHAHGKSFRYGPDLTDTESW